MLEDQKNINRFMEIQGEITELLKEIQRLQEKIYYLARERDSL